MSAVDRLLGEFIDDWNAGRRPRVGAYLERVPAGAQRDELAEALTTWLELAPTPEHDERTRASIRAEPALRDVLDGAAVGAGLWPELLPRLRARAGLSPADLAARVVRRFGLAPSAEDRATDYLQRLERGELEPARVSRRLLDALGELLGASGATLADAAGLAGALRPAPGPAGGTLFRTTGDPIDRIADDLDALSRAATTPAPPPMDELDRLFAGGPGA